MRKCAKCEAVVENRMGKTRAHGFFTCLKCQPFEDELTFSEIHIDEEKGEVEVVSPFCDVQEGVQRDRLIALIHGIFPKPNKSVYRLINQYLKKGYTYLGMIRALEWFYYVKKNSTAKSNNSIGIIPYVYDDAQKFYEFIDRKNKEKAEQYLKTANYTPKEIVVDIEHKQKKSQIDMNNI